MYICDIGKNIGEEVSLLPTIHDMLSIFEIPSDTVPIFCPYIIQFSCYVGLSRFCNKKRNVYVLESIKRG